MNKLQKPKAPLIGADGNIFNLMGIVSRTLRKAGQGYLVQEMNNRVTSCSDYNEALNVLFDYVEPVEVESNKSFYGHNDIDY